MLAPLSAADDAEGVLVLGLGPRRITTIPRCRRSSGEAVRHAGRVSAPADANSHPRRLVGQSRGAKTHRSASARHRHPTLVRAGAQLGDNGPDGFRPARRGGTGHNGPRRLGRGRHRDQMHHPGVERITGSLSGVPQTGRRLPIDPRRSVLETGYSGYGWSPVLRTAGVTAVQYRRAGSWCPRCAAACGAVGPVAQGGRRSSPDLRGHGSASTPPEGPGRRRR